MFQHDLVRLVKYQIQWTNWRQKRISGNKKSSDSWHQGDPSCWLDGVGIWTSESRNRIQLKVITTWLPWLPNSYFTEVLYGAHFEIDRVRILWISCMVFWDRWQNCKLTSLNCRYYGLLWHTLEIWAPRAIDCQSYIREHTHSSWTTMDSLWFRPFLLRSDERSEAGSGCCILWKCDLKLGPSKENCAHGKINGFASGCYVKI